MMSQDLGFAGDQMLTVSFNMDEGYRKVEGMREAFLSIPGVKEITTASRFPGHGYPDWSIDIEGREEMVYPRILFADAHYDDVLNLEMAEGRFFSSDHSSSIFRIFSSSRRV